MKYLRCIVPEEVNGEPRLKIYDLNYRAHQTLADIPVNFINSTIEENLQEIGLVSDSSTELVQWIIDISKALYLVKLRCKSRVLPNSKTLESLIDSLTLRGSDAGGKKVELTVRFRQNAPRSRLKKIRIPHRLITQRVHSLNTDITKQYEYGRDPDIQNVLRDWCEMLARIHSLECVIKRKDKRIPSSVLKRVYRFLVEYVEPVV